MSLLKALRGEIIEGLGLVWEHAFQRLPQEPVDADQKGRQRFFRPRGAAMSGMPPLRDRGPPQPLGSVGSRNLPAEPFFHDGMKRNVHVYILHYPRQNSVQKIYIRNDSRGRADFYTGNGSPLKGGVPMNKLKVIAVSAAIFRVGCFITSADSGN